MTPQAQKYQQAGNLFLAAAELLAVQYPDMTAAELARLMHQSQAAMDETGVHGQVKTVQDMVKVVQS